MHLQNSVTEEKISRFLVAIRAELDCHKRFMEMYAPQLAPRFNPIERLYPDENRLSSIIAMLLDPKGEHGQGIQFLNIFLDIITPKDDSEKQSHLESFRHHFNQVENIALASCQLESSTNFLDENKNRRIDILLDINKFGLAIENKPWAIDQPCQIVDYHAHLSHKNNFDENFILIYLSASGSPPGSDSINERKRLEIESTGHFITMSYAQLKEWILLCAEKSKSPRVRFFLEEFSTYIRDKFEGGKIMEEKQIIENAIKPENVSAAVVVGFAWPEISRALIVKLFDFVEKDLNKNFSTQDSDDWLIHNQNNFDISSPSSVYVVKKGWDKYCIGFDFESKNANNFGYGISTNPNLPDEKRKELRNKFICSEESNIEELRIGEVKSSHTWPWYKFFDGDYRDWSKSENPWTQICEGGEVVKVISNKIKALKYVCDQANKPIP